MLYFSKRFKECRAVWLACGVLISPSLKKVWTPLVYRVHHQFFWGENMKHSVSFHLDMSFNLYNQT